MTTLKPNGQRAKNAMIILWIVLGMEIITFISDYFQYDLLQRAKNLAPITSLEVAANDFRVKIVTVVYLIVYIVCVVMFIQWFRRAYYNLHVKVPNLLFTDGWAAGSWFVPIMHLYRPYQIMRELHEETIDLCEKKKVSSLGLSTDLLGWWWFSWIVSSALGRIAGQISNGAESISQLENSTLAGMIHSVFNIPLTLLILKIIYDYSKVEPILFDLKDEEEVQEETLIAE
jgi:hypothetical protein